MSLAPLVETKGMSWFADAYTIGAYATPDSRYFVCNFGDGTVRILDLTAAADGFKVIEVHKGSAMCLSPDMVKGAFLSGGDDGKLVKIDVDGATEVVADLGRKWVEHVTATETGYRAYASGKDVFIQGKKKGDEPRKVTHASSVGGLAINPKGRRLAVSHYDSVSLWWLATKDGQAQALPWKGSHLQVTWSPDGDYVVSTMQENSLHGWRLSDGQHFRMEGYGAKIRALSFVKRGQFLATGGADTVICWPFTGGGPMGKAPQEFGGMMNGPPVTCVAAHPKMDVIAAGFENGKVIVGQPGSPRVMPIAEPFTDKENSAVSVLAWTPDGDRLLAGTENGDVHVVDFRAIS
ncbi:MAG: WD40 repeat domain-containing protein [Rhodospirillaceae bacterium]|nr:WD40 repeat domain-containing protein [Rhodospirillaceae bacterium]